MAGKRTRPSARPRETPVHRHRGGADFSNADYLDRNPKHLLSAVRHDSAMLLKRANFRQVDDGFPPLSLVWPASGFSGHRFALPGERSLRLGNHRLCLRDLRSGNLYEQSR